METEIKKSVRRALIEDRISQDITTNILVPRSQISEAFIIVKENSVVCGLEIIKNVFRRIDPGVKIKYFCKDGTEVKKSQKIVHLKGKTRALLSGERVALNFLAYLSGIANLTNKFVKQVHPYPVKIMDTRKTIPGLRALVKMAVRTGGGVNHRFNLKEMVMIKDNHHIAYSKKQPISDVIKKVRKKTPHRIVVEVDTMAQFRKAMAAKPNIILLDNMNTRQLRRAVELNKKNPKPYLLEASGGINLRNIRAIAETGVDRISIGALTHSPKATDYSMEFNI